MIKYLKKNKETIKCALALYSIILVGALLLYIQNNG